VIRAARLGRRLLVAVHIGLAAGFAIACARSLLTPGGVVATDFTVYWTGWWLILHGDARALYDVAAQRETQQMLMGGLHFQGGLMAFLNPPHAALAGAPFGWLADHAGERAAFLAWTAVSAMLLVTLDRWLREAWGATAGSARWMITSALVAFYPVFHTIQNGQTSLLLAVAVIGVYRAVDASRPVAAAAWLLALSVKPQLMPAILVFLVARRCWRALAYAAAMLAAAAAVAAACLGPTIWIDYVRHVGELEQFFGTGTPVHMVNVRGALTRLGDPGAQPAIDTAAFIVWIAATGLVGLVFWQRRIHERADARRAYAFAVAIALLTSPHVFIQDAAIWVVPLVLYAAALRDAGDRWQRFATFALCWPALFAVARRIDLAGGGAPILPIDPQVVALVVATVAIVP
jgi:glycosyl transferase family 87